MNETALIAFYAGLSERKQDIVRLVCQGYSNQAIAASLYVSKATVAEHLTEIFERMRECDALGATPPNRYGLISRFAPFFSNAAG